MKHKPVYLDNNATTPLDPRVLEKMLPYLKDTFGNPSSGDHIYGWLAEEAVEEARAEIASLIGAQPGDIFFTSSATESINLALRGVFYSDSNSKKHIITATTEHKAVLDTLKSLERDGAHVTFLNVDNEGRIDLKLLLEAIREDTLMICLMYGNNETGLINPIHEIGLISKDAGTYFFCDATQAVGKIPIDLETSNIDLLVFAGHKIFGPKGAGALYIRSGGQLMNLSPQQTGGGQERKLRSGTLNVPAIVGLGEACRIAKSESENDRKRLLALRDFFEEQISSKYDVHIHCKIANRLSHVSNIMFKYTDGHNLMNKIRQRVACSRSSACTSAVIQASHVIKAMHYDYDDALSSFRFSLGRFTTEHDINIALETLFLALEKLKNERN